jgi:hypothetical protein
VGSAVTLAYVFWHRPGPEADVPAYEGALTGFHASLAAAPPPGFRGSVAFARAAQPWFDGYEDWYLVDDWTALGVLNAAAVDLRHATPHDAVADRAVAGAGAVFRCDMPLDLRGVRAATWSSEPLVGDAVWRRQMVLGPAPQYCAHHATPVAGAIAREALG